MAQTVIKILTQKIELNDVADIVFTEPVQDSDGNWVREFRFVGSPGEDESASPMTLVVRAVSPVKNNLNLTTEPLEI
jgi:hypothetical protein